ncbi:hypothetical protein A6U87_14940 [Rhizobium sp. AC44/96]|uniref:hypothetical protein n=1 Tax=Rhizobium sp. AC44/96 TaxID=1841654 RepID=UPI00080FF392|nr:hypothetical protein [Rhizobium sp. AC44/96]OCJ05297.1 hypothetical protein A6U87_14940 [Rhizobium sp. AC44/96]
MTFTEAFTLYPYDVERIAAETGMSPPVVDREINKLMQCRHDQRVKAEKRRIAQRDHMRRVRADLPDLRARRPA